jgi:hypothetical protein
MGELLQIRVTAWTWRPEDVEETWLGLYTLAWPAPPPPPSTPPVTTSAPTPKRGVLEMVEALDEQSRFGSWSKETEQILESGLKKVLTIKALLEKALGDWNPSLAEKRSNELEDALTELDDKATDLKNKGLLFK